MCNQACDLMERFRKEDEAFEKGVNCGIVLGLIAGIILTLLFCVVVYYF